MNEPPITLIHISDLHFTSNSRNFSEQMKGGRLLSKRYLGWLNYNLLRKHHFSDSVKKRLFEKLADLNWDYLIITGDLTSLSLTKEFEEAKNHIMPLAGKGKILLTPGNHDRYVRERDNTDPISEIFRDFWPFSEQASNPGTESFLEIGDRAVIVEFDMAIPRGFHSSRGKLNLDLDPVRKRLENSYKNRIKIAIGHYPAFIPPNEHEGYFHSLSGRKIFKQFLLDHDFSLYLHGHIHKSWNFNPVEGKGLTCVNSGGCCRHLTGEWSGFHKIIIAPEATSVERIQL